MVLGTISDNITRNPSFYAHLGGGGFGQAPLRNSIAMATPKIPGDQRLFERVCYMLKLKVTKFHLPRPNAVMVSELYLKTSWGWQICPPPPSKIGLKQELLTAGSSAGTLDSSIYLSTIMKDRDLFPISAQVLTCNRRRPFTPDKIDKPQNESFLKYCLLVAKNKIT